MEAVATEPEVTRDELSPYQVERGKPMPSRNHGIVQARLIGELLKAPHYQPFSELTLDMGERPYAIPDISLFPKEEIDFSTDEVRVTEPPLLTVEILSPTQGWIDLMEHVARYLRHGVKSCWIVTPFNKTITIYTIDGQKTYTEGLVTDPNLDVSVDLAAVFA